jgi:hypothetical protein
MVGITHSLSIACVMVVVVVVGGGVVGAHGIGPSVLLQHCATLWRSAAPFPLQACCDSGRAWKLGQHWYTICTLSSCVAVQLLGGIV